MKKISKWIIAAGMAAILTSSVMAQVANVGFDFGTDPGRQTFEDAGFTYFEENTNAGVTQVTNKATAVEFTCTTRFQSGIEQAFSGLGVGQTDPFSISMDLTITSFPVNSNLRRVYGIRMFGSETNGFSGLAARLVSDANDEDEIEISVDGASGTGYKENLSTNWNGGEIQVGVPYTFTVDGNFVGADNLRLVFTVSDGVDSHTITNIVSSDALDGDYFGIVGDGDQVVSVSSWSVSPLSVPPDITAPTVPTNLAAVAGIGTDEGTVSLDWDDSTDDSTGDSAGVAYYNIYRSETSESYGGAITSVTASAYVDADVVNGTTYYYKVSAVDGSGNESAQSAEASATPVLDTTPPAAPANVSATQGDAKVNLDWDDNAEPDLASYNVYRSTTPGGPFVTALTNVTGSTYVDTDVVNGTTYYYVITAVDSSAGENESAQSAQVSATPSAAPIPAGTIVFGSANDGLGGFTTSTPGGADEIWTTETDSVRFRNQNTGTKNSSFLREYVLDTSPGNSYTFEGVVEMTDGYADDNNRLGFYLFGGADEVPSENEAGAIGVIFNTDDNVVGGPPGNNADDRIQVRVGIDANPVYAEADRNEATIPFAQDLFGTEVKFTVDVVYTNVGGTDQIIVNASMTDKDLNVTTVPEVSLVASNYTGSYFGFVNRARARNYPDTAANRGAPWVMSYKSFTFTDNNGLVGYDAWIELYGGTNVIGGADDDYDNDGVDNITEYGLNGDPTNSLVQGSALPVFSKSGSAFIYVHPERTDDTNLTYTVETTTDLVNVGWAATGYTAGGTDSPGGLFDFVTNNVTTGEAQKFIRLKVE